ncbi:uncharacterized protein LOC117219088 [Megalopta genalis]|uniref:uncharacterized protein LOC117219088 n=1 Tax=Megalopta genalis TaxID=115081 RepID=UPI003FD67A98
MGTFTVKVIRGRGMYRFIFGGRENIYREASDIKDLIDAVFVRDTGFQEKVRSDRQTNQRCVFFISER